MSEQRPRPSPGTTMATMASSSSSSSSSSLGGSGGKGARRRPPLDPTPSNFPCGTVSARRHILLAFRNSSDARTTISEFQRDNGLHANFARAFGTVPVHVASAVGGDVDVDVDVGGKGAEPLDPSPALDFLSRLGVSRHEAHVRVASALRSAIEDEVQRVPASIGPDGRHGHPALLGLLASSWQFRDVPELRPVLVCVLRRLGERVPAPMLRRLGARRAGSDTELRNGDLVGQLGPHLRRLVWEADWDAIAASGDGGGVEGGGATLGGHAILADLIRPSVRGYATDAALVRRADLAFVGTAAERRLVTRSRRTAGAGEDSSEAPGGSTADARSVMASIRMSKGGAAVAAPTGTGNDGEEKSSSSAVAVASIKEIIGDRPKLLGAVLDMLIADHATKGGRLRDGTATGSIVGGATNLTCSLVADVLLSFGQLPRSYEVLDIMARTLDSSVQSGTISDDAISQVQGCLRAIFRPTPSEQQLDRTEGTKIKLSLKPAKAPTSMFPDMPVDDSEYERKLIQRVVKTALQKMKENDPQGLFLNPVTDAIAPGYYGIIETPMCIRTMEEKMMNSTYKSIDEYKEDTLLIFSNCCKYNVGPAGQWFRTEAERQKKIWKDVILPDAKIKLKAEMLKRRNALKRISRPPPPLAFAPGKVDNAPLARGRKKEAKEDTAINNLTVQDVKPLPPWKCKRRKIELEIPSMQCLASMLLADPFFMRVLVDKIVKILRADVLTSKTVPSGHPLLPSMFQLLNIARISTELCALNGKQCYVPDAGIRKVLQDGEDFSSSFESTRNRLPLFAKLLLDADLDRRMVAGGDLHDAALQNVLSRPVIQIKEWEGTSSLYDLRAVVECAFVHVIQPGNSHELALRNQFPRFVAALDELSGGDMLNERPFLVSLSHALLRYKSKLPHSTRDLATRCLIRWLKMGGKISPKAAVCSPLHECFIFLLNEWSLFGNLVLSRELLLSLGEEAVAASIGIDIGQKCDDTFAQIWSSDDDGFLAVKEQYTRMLSSTPEARAAKWKQKVGINATLPSSPTEGNPQVGF